MKHNWEYKKLGDVCTIVGRIGFRGYKRSDYVEGLNDGAISLSPSNINNGVLDYSKCTFISWGKYKESPEIMIENGDVLLVKTASVGKSAYVEHLPHETTINPQFVVLKHISANHKYIAYVVKSNSFLLDLKSITFGSSVPTLSQKDLADLSIPVPPLSEQSRIVAELDLLTGIIDKQNAQLKELDNLAQAIFYDMFGDPVENPKGWDVKNIGDIADVKIGPFGSLLHASDYINGGHPVINPVHLKAGKIIAEDDFTVNDDMYAQMMSYVLHKNDIVFGRRGDIGRCALVTQEQDGYLCGTGSLFVRFNIQVQPLFSVATLMHKSITDFLLKKAKGATMLNINCGIVENIPFILPPLTLQQSFAEKIQSIEKQKEAIRASIADTQKLLDYTMDKYFG